MIQANTYAKLFLLLTLTICAWRYDLVGDANAATPSKRQDPNELAAVIDPIQERLAPDARLEYFNFTVDLNHSPRRATIETTVPQAKEEILNAVKSFDDWQVDVKILPQENADLNGRWRALVRFSTIQLQRRPEYASEWMTQSIMGAPVKILKRESNGWSLIQNYDGYIGYTPSGNLQPLTEEEYLQWLNAKRLICVSRFAFIYRERNASGDTISDLVAGNVLVDLDDSDDPNFKHAQTPDGRQGWVKADDVMDWNLWVQSRQLNAENIIATARSLMGAPYVWGGTTTKGVDCSGLVNVAFYLNGYNIMRDVSLIRLEGIDVDRSQGWSNYQPGDLLIFGEPRPSGAMNWRHVAIYIGEGRFIHSATSVRENSLDPNDPDYDRYNATRIIKVVRMLGAPKTEHFHPIQENIFLHNFDAN
ncbi:MAG: SH3 domain-containing C40 family peptidase [Planctomycetia bacterium]|nr:SH3 domain-containing C40 family peptidase [Planctomycetia bacterium]